MKNIESRSVLATMLGALLLSCSGCSLIFVKPPPSTGRIVEGRGQCTSSKLAPIVDTIVTGAQVARTAYALTANDSVYDDPAQPLSRGVDVGLGLGLTALFLGSAVYGYVNTSKCAKLNAGPSDADETLPAEKWNTSPSRRENGSSAEQSVQPATAASTNAPVDSPATANPPIEGQGLDGNPPPPPAAPPAEGTAG